MRTYCIHRELYLMYCDVLNGKETPKGRNIDIDIDVVDSFFLCSRN